MEAVKVPTMLTIKELSEKSGLSYDCIRNWCLQGKIVYIKAGNKYLVNYEKFIDYLNGEKKEEKQ